MSLEQINYIAEIVASLAVIASLIYVGREIAQNTQATRAAAAQANVGAVNDYVGVITGSGSLADILNRGAKGLSQLKNGDLIRFMAFHDQSFITCQSYYLLWKDGALDERLWATHRQAALDLLAQPGQKEWWTARRHWYFPDFVEYIEQAASSSGVKRMHPGAFADS